MDQPSRWLDADVLLYKLIMNQAIYQLTYRLIHNELALFSLGAFSKSQKENHKEVSWTQSFS